MMNFCKSSRNTHNYFSDPHSHYSIDHRNAFVSGEIDRPHPVPMFLFLRLPMMCQLESPNQQRAMQGDLNWQRRHQIRRASSAFAA